MTIHSGFHTQLVTIRTSRLPLQFGSAPQSRSKSTTSGRSLMAAQWRGVTLVMVMVRIDMKMMTIVLVGEKEAYVMMLTNMMKTPTPESSALTPEPASSFSSCRTLKCFSLIEMLLLFIGLHFTSPEPPAAQQEQGRGYCDRHWVEARPILLAQFR